MGSVATLPLSTVVDVSVLISPQAPATPTFNQGLIIGTSPVIGSVTGANPRLRQYTTLAQIAADGFSLASPEYIAASIYFSQSPAPLYIWIGRQDLTAIASLSLGAVPGTGYAVGDLFNIVQGGASLGVGQVTAEAAGIPTAVAVIGGRQGTLYTVANNLATTAITGVGINLEVDVTAVGETPLQAVQACRLASPNWYLVCALTAVDVDHIAIGTWAQAQTPQCVYFYTTGTAAALNGTAGTDPFSTLKTGSFSRAFGLYSTTQGGLFPNNAYSQAAAMGVAMGRNTGLNGSYFTMKFKQLVGIAPENPTLSQTQISSLESRGANLHLSFANTFSWLEQGTVANGQFFDEILNLDMLASDMQFSCVDLLVSNPAILQTNSGQTQILNAILGACARSAARGFISGGNWSGPNITGLNTILLANGAPLPNGYTALSDVYANQAQSDRDARKSMPVYVPIIESGAVHSILIGVFVQQ